MQGNANYLQSASLNRHGLLKPYYEISVMHSLRFNYDEKMIRVFHIVYYRIFLLKLNNNETGCFLHVF